MQRDKHEGVGWLYRKLATGCFVDEYALAPLVKPPSHEPAKQAGDNDSNGEPVLLFRVNSKLVEKRARYAAQSHSYNEKKNDKEAATGPKNHGDS